ncbi:TspO/MBR family protein [Nocardioides currus]|uniref:Tryptophan-rich sensory protein n=1 Tax=Nocardioides currus TaxID=2133958 RepID=A0A2R7Z1C9_9ACTN|nr:TspO/MBR family protein [Nocardioides currus]PUA82425.1 tryptophan-rich sensory protein [Nocardioides currus]
MTTTSAAPGTRSWLSLLPFLAAVAAVAVVGGLAAGSAGDTYRDLDLPPFAPPSWLFGPVWSVLYVMIGVAGWLLWRTRGWDAALTLWAVQLVLNLAWTPLFFAASRYTLALVDIVALALMILGLIWLARSRSTTAAWLLVPYAAWVCFATALNAGIVILN